MNSLKFPLDFALAIGNLKHVKRAGWLRYPKISDVESVSDHSYRMSLLSLLFLKEEHLDVNKCIKMALVHDLAESVVGDITPYDNISNEEKHAKENDALDEITKNLPQEIRDIVYGLWKEYEEGRTEEAKIVKDLDKYEMILQAYNYESKYQVDLEEFYKSVNVIKNIQVKEWALQIIEERKKLKKTD
jgi:putative hydrolases of HD superfamily